MRLPLLVLALVVGCESTAPSSDVFAPVAPPTAPAAPIPTDAAPTDLNFVPDADFSISSEQMQQNAEEAGDASVAVAEAVVSSTASEPLAAEPAPAAPVVVEPVPAPTTVVLPADPKPDSSIAAMLGALPLRLVKTIPEAQPPRAILALADGTEIVVTPGQLLPGPGVVVLSVGRQTLDLARVSPRGDHAEIAPLTLFSQY